MYCQIPVMMITPQTKEGSSFSLRTAAVNRRHSADGILSSGSGRGHVDSDRFHPYHQQFGDGAVTAAGHLQQCSPSFSSPQEVCIPDSHSHSSKMPPSWEQYNGSIQVSILMVHSFLSPPISKSLCSQEQPDIWKAKKQPHSCTY